MDQSLPGFPNNNQTQHLTILLISQQKISYMFAQAWNKYLPVIKILMKRSSSGEQTLAMNKTDFERAAGGRKAKLTFSFTLVNARNQNYTAPPPVARDFITLLQEDEATRQMLRNEEFTFSMNTSFNLLIRKTESANTIPEGTGNEATESDKDTDQ
jgi:hypothetical protein